MHFSHHEFREYDFESVPLNQDLFLMDEKWLEDYERALVDMFNGKDYENVGYISYAAARRTSTDSIELSWYPNIMDRFHEVSIQLPRNAFIACVDCPRYDEKPHVFVKSDWLTKLHLRPYSAFALVDAIGVKNALIRGQLSGPKLIELRTRIDSLAEKNPGVAFVSFADSLLLKANWSVGQYDSDIKYSYEPENLVRLVPRIVEIYETVLGMKIYAAIAQGVNEYEDSSLLHTSTSGNHISLNSLGLPFAQLLSIDEAVRTAIRSGAHPPSDLYIDEQYYHSLNFRHGFDKHAQPKASYSAPMSSVKRNYFYLGFDTVISNLEDLPPRKPRR